MAKTFAKIFGLTILAIAVVGLIVGDEFIGFNTELVEDLVHILTGGLLAAVGFAGSDSSARSVVGALSVVYILVGILGFVVPDLFGLLPEVGYKATDNILHLAIGGLGLAALAADRGAATA